MNISINNVMQVGSHEFQVTLGDQVYYIEAHGKNSFRTSNKGNLVDLVFDPKYQIITDSHNIASFISPYGPKSTQTGGRVGLAPVGHFVPNLEPKIPVIPLKKVDTTSKWRRFKQTVDCIIVVCFIISKFFPSYLPKILFDEEKNGFVTSSLTLLQPMSVLDNVFSTVCAVNFPMQIPQISERWWFENIFRKVSPLNIDRISLDPIQSQAPLTVTSPLPITKQLNDMIQEVCLANATWLHETNLGVTSTVPAVLTQKFEDYLTSDSTLLGASTATDIFLKAYTETETSVSHILSQLKNCTDTVLNTLVIENLKARKAIQIDIDELEEIRALLEPQVVALAEGTLKVLTTLVKLGDNVARPLLEKFTTTLQVKSQEAAETLAQASYSFVVNSPIYAVDVLYGSIDIALETIRILDETQTLISSVEWPVNVAPLPTVKDITYLTEALYHSSQIVLEGTFDALVQVKQVLPEIKPLYKNFEESYQSFMDYFFNTRETNLPSSTTEKVIEQVKSGDLNKTALRTIASAYWMSQTTCQVQPLPLPKEKIDTSIIGSFWNWYSNIKPLTPVEQKELVQNYEKYLADNAFWVLLTEALVTTLVGEYMTTSSVIETVFSNAGEKLVEKVVETNFITKTIEKVVEPNFITKTIEKVVDPNLIVKTIEKVIGPSLFTKTLEKIYIPNLNMDPFKIY